MANGEKKQVEKIVEVADKPMGSDKKMKPPQSKIVFGYDPETMKQVANLLNTLEIKAGIDNAKKLVEIMNMLESGQQISVTQQEG